MNSKITYIIATLGLFDVNNNAFTSLKRQTSNDFIAYIIHQGNESFDFELVRNINYRYFHLDNIGLSNARNYGILNSNTELISLLDDDAVLPPEYTNNVISKFYKYKCDVLCGIVIDPITNKPIARGIYNNSSFLMGRNNLNYFMSSAITAKTSILINNLFDTDFGLGSKYGASEESDLFLRLYNDNKIYFDGELIVFHPSDNSKLSQLSAIKIFSRGYNYGVGRGALLKKFYLITGVYFLYFFIKTIILSLCVILFDIISFNFNYALRDTGSLIGKLHGFFIYHK